MYIAANYHLTKMLSNYKGDIIKFTLEKPGRHHLNQGVK